MIVRFTVKDYDGFCHQFSETHQAVDSVAERIFKMLSDVSFVASVSVSKLFSGIPGECQRYWGRISYPDSLQTIYKSLIDL